MVAFEIFINGQKRLTAGGDEYTSINALLGIIRLPLPKPDDTNITFVASAISSDQERAALWPILELAVGDRIEIRVVDSAVVDAPESVQTLEKASEND